MSLDRPYFFCGIGGSGMLPLALIVAARGVPVAGSDRALDQGRTGAKFDFLRARGIKLYPQDGSGVTSSAQCVVTSAAVEETVPDVQAARSVGATLMVRAALLAELFNGAPQRIAIAGTSGKSTTTGMIGWILHATGRDPTVMNGAVMKNFATGETPFASALVGRGDAFISEVDESDGSIARYVPTVAVLNNISLDHKSMTELRALFGDFLARAGIAVINRDNAEAWALSARLPSNAVLSYSLGNRAADLVAEALEPRADGIAFDLIERASGGRHRATLAVPGRHNVANALAALAGARAAGVPLGEALAALAQFTGVKRRLEVVGTARGITVIDDFAHNPDKIEATLATLHDFPGRLLVLFQPHGFGPLKLMRQGFIDVFADHLQPDDRLIMTDPVYFGGTVERSVTSADIVDGIRARGRQGDALGDRAACGAHLLTLATPGDRIVIMGARDDTLSEFAGELLRALA